MRLLPGLRARFNQYSVSTLQSPMTSDAHSTGDHGGAQQSIHRRRQKNLREPARLKSALEFRNANKPHGHPNQQHRARWTVRDDCQQHVQCRGCTSYQHDRSLLQTTEAVPGLRQCTLTLPEPCPEPTPTPYAQGFSGCDPPSTLLPPLPLRYP